ATPAMVAITSSAIWILPSPVSCCCAMITPPCLTSPDKDSFPAQAFLLARIFAVCYTISGFARRRKSDGQGMHRLREAHPDRQQRQPLQPEDAPGFPA